MINLYELLNLPPDATAAEIEAAVRALQAAGKMEPNVQRAVSEWLLREDVRRRYDEKLRAEQPEWFARHEGRRQAQNAHKPNAAPPHRTFRIPAPGAPAPTQAMRTARQDGLPYLWNPMAAALLALLFSLLFIWLHALNWEALGEEKKARQNRLFVYGVTAMAVLSAALAQAGLLPVAAENQLPVSAFVNLMLWLGWFLTMGREQVQLVDGQMGGAYQKRPWGKAVGMVVLATMGILAAGLFVLLLLQIAGVAQVPP